MMLDAKQVRKQSQVSDDVALALAWPSTYADSPWL